MSLARVQFFSVSLDGFGTGEGLSRDAPFGHAGDRLHEWMFVTRWWHEMVGEPGGSGGIDDAFLRLHDPGIGAEIMGAGKFGYPGWHEDPDVEGLVGSRAAVPHAGLRPHPPPTPVHRDGGRHDLPLPRRLAGRGARDGPRRRRRPGRTHRRGPYRGPRLPCRRALDHMHIVVVPILLGRGVRLWDGLEGLEKDYQIEATSSPSGVTHVTFTRTAL